LLRGETVSIEPIVGYLRGSSGEYVYNTGNSNQKLSQLDWNINALAVGGRVAIRPSDWFTVRGRFWATVASDGEMTDYDWLAGYFGKNSWTDRSVHPDTKLAKAWQGDLSIAVPYYASEDLALTIIAGYRHYDVKYASAVDLTLTPASR
jgi:outer membrane protease